MKYECRIRQFRSEGEIGAFQLEYRVIYDSFGLLIDGDWHAGDRYQTLAEARKAKKDKENFGRDGKVIE
jgi:hypothetical protein